MVRQTRHRNRSLCGDPREIKRAPRRKVVVNSDGLVRRLNGVAVWREFRCAAALTSNPEDATERDESGKSKHDMMYDVCMAITYVTTRGRQTNVKIDVVPHSS